MIIVVYYLSTHKLILRCVKQYNVVILNYTCMSAKLKREDQQALLEGYFQWSLWPGPQEDGDVLLRVGEESGDHPPPPTEGML